MLAGRGIEKGLLSGVRKLLGAMDMSITLIVAVVSWI